MSGPYGGDAHGRAGDENGRDENGGGESGGSGREPDPTRQFPQPGGFPPPGYSQQPPYPPPGYGPPRSPYPPPGYGPPPPGYRPPPPGYGPPGYGQPPPPKRNLTPWLAGGVALVVIIVALVVVFVAVSRNDDTTNAAAATSTTAAPATSSSVPAMAVPPLPSSLSRTPRPTSTPRPTPTTTPAKPSTTAAGIPGIPANPEQTQQITALAKALVDAVSNGDRAALVRITCGALADQVQADSTDANKTIYDHVENIKINPDGTAGTMDVFAYTAENGPPATSLTFVVHKFGSEWKACDTKD